MLLESFDRGQLWFAIKWNFSKQSLCPLNDLVCRRSDLGIPRKRKNDLKFHRLTSSKKYIRVILNPQRKQLGATFYENTQKSSS